MRLEVVLRGRMCSASLRVGGADFRSAAAAMDEIGVTDLASRLIGEPGCGQRRMVLIALAPAAPA